MSPRLPLANEDSSMAESLSLKSIEVDVRNLSHIDAKSVDFDMFLNQLMSFDKLVSLCQYCSKNITPKLKDDFESLFVEIVILCFAGVQQYLVNDLEICAKIFNHRLESIPAVAQELERILGTKEIPQIFNLDNVFRQMFSSVLQGSKARPRQLGKNEKKSGNSRADDLPATIDEEPSKKRLLKILSPRENDSTGRCNEQPSTFRKIENPLSSRIGEIMAGFVRAKKRKPAKVVQIRLIAVLDDDSIEVEDPWPKDPSNPSIWTLNNADVVDYLSFKYTAKDFREGDFVYALFRMDGEVSSEFYAGMIAKINSENVTVQFEDSDCEVVDFNQIIKGSDVPERHSLPSAPASAK